MQGAKDAEEESGSEDDEHDPEAESEDGLASVQEVAPVVPLRFNLGSLAEANLSSAKTKKKAAPKKGGKKLGGGTGDTGSLGGVPEGDEVMETGGDETSSLELYNEIEARKDTQLRQVIKALDCSPSSVPVCLAGMFPDKVLFEKFKAGHQLKGVPWFVLNLPQ